MIGNPAPLLFRHPEELAVYCSPTPIIVRLPVSPRVIIVVRGPPDIAAKIVPNPFSIEVRVFLSKIDDSLGISIDSFGDTTYSFMKVFEIFIHPFIPKPKINILLAFSFKSLVLFGDS